MHDIMAQKNTLSHKRAYINCLHSVNYKERAGLILVVAWRQSIPAFTLPAILPANKAAFSALPEKPVGTSVFSLLKIFVTTNFN